MSWFRKRPEPQPARAAIPGSAPQPALPPADRPSVAEPSLEIELDAAEDSGIGQQRTVISIDTTVKGHVTTASDLFVAGQIDGDVESGAAVHVANEGVISGDVTALRVRVDVGAGVDGEINASDVFIEGRVRGNVAAGGRLELGGSADVIGDVRARTLHVEEGATLQGRCTSG